MNFKRKQLNFLIIQHRIVQATQKQQQRKIRNLQRLLIKSLSTRVQTILIASKKRNEYFFFLKPPFFLKKEKPKTGLSFFYCKTFSQVLKNSSQKKIKKKFLIEQTKDLNSLNFDFIKKFILIFSKKIKRFFVIAKKIFKESKKKDKTYLFSSSFEEEKTICEKKQTLNTLQTMFLFFLQSLSFSTKKNLKKTKNSLFLVLWKLAFSPVVETLLKEKNFRNPSEILLFLNNFCFKSKNFLERNSKEVEKKKVISLWILKLEIQGFDKYLNNSWLYQNIPIELFVLKKIFEQRKQMFSKECFFSKKSQKKSLFHKDFFTKWKNLSSERDFFDNFYNTNFNNFFSFCLIGLEIFLKEIFCILDAFYFSEFLFSKKLQKSIDHKELKKIKKIFFYTRSIYLIGLNRRQFQRIKKLINFFLKKRGLDLKNITYFNLKKGFDFLGWTLKITKKKSLMVTISEKFQRLQKKEIKWLIKNSMSQLLYKLIRKLNNKIEKDLIEYENQRLCNIVKNIEIFYSDLNFFINKIFWKWAKKRHNNRSNVWIFQKYWDLRNKKNFLISKKPYYLQSKKEVFNEYKKRVFVLLYQKSRFLNSQKNQKHYVNSKSFLFKKYKKDLYFLNFYSLDFQTQYYFFIFLEQ